MVATQSMLPSSKLKITVSLPTLLIINADSMLSITKLPSEKLILLLMARIDQPILTIKLPLSLLVTVVLEAALKRLILMLP
jgi:hypothetical protein